MSLANLTRFERFFDRNVAAFLLVMGLTMAGAFALLGVA